MRIQILVAGLILASAATASLAPAAAADLPGSKDPPFLKRYEGSEIVGYRTRTFDKYTMSRESLFKRTEARSSSRSPATPTAPATRSIT
jgi:hypothetical protein